MHASDKHSSLFAAAPLTKKKFSMTGTWTQRAFVQAFAFRPHGEGLELDGVGHRLGDDGHVGDRVVPPRRFRLVFDHAGVDVIKTYFAAPLTLRAKWFYLAMKSRQYLRDATQGATILNIKGLFATFNINETRHNTVVLLSAVIQSVAFC